MDSATGSGPIKRSVAELWTRYSAALRPNGQSVGVQLGLSTTVWGFKSGKDIDDCEYPQVNDSNKCPEGDLNPLPHVP